MQEVERFTVCGEEWRRYLVVAEDRSGVTGFLEPCNPDLKYRTVNGLQVSAEKDGTFVVDGVPGFKRI